MNWQRTGAIVVFLVVFAGGSFAVVYYWGFGAYYYPEAPAPHYAEPRNPADAQRDDLDYLRQYLVRDWSYTPQSRAEAGAVIDAALAAHLPLSRGRFELVVSRVVAMADNGHSNVWAATRANRLNRLPLRFYLFADGLYVVRALPQAQDALGMKVIAFDGHPFAQVRRTMNEYSGGTAEDRDMRLPFFLEAPQLLHAAGMANADDRVTLTVEAATGARRDVRLVALPPDAAAPKVWPVDNIRPAAIPKEGRNWRPALSGAADKMPLFADAEHAFVMRPLPKHRAFYIRFNTNESTDTDSIADFDRKIEAAILAARPDIVIVDMRFNGGGDYTVTASFMRNLPLELPAARFYVLEGPDTFSAGMTSVAFLKQAGGSRTVLVGARPGDRIRFHSEGSDFCLPFSKICTSARTAIHDYSTTRCRPLAECFVLNWFYPVAIKSFEPQIYAPLTYKALLEGRDPALDAILPQQGP